MTDDIETISDLVTALQITITSTRIDQRSDVTGGTWGAGASHWRVTLAHDGRSITVEFSQGSTYTDPPTTTLVLGSLASDASGVDQSFEEWASDYGYDPDSRRAERTWQACRKVRADLEFLMGDHFDRTLAAEY